MCCILYTSIICARRNSEFGRNVQSKYENSLGKITGSPLAKHDIHHHMHAKISLLLYLGKYKSGGCWMEEDLTNVPDEKEDLARHGTKIMSAMSPQELLQLLKSTDFDEKHEINAGEQVRKLDRCINKVK